MMNITSALFDCSAPDLASCPDETLAEFAFIGRSNVGKSSLLNMLTGKAGLARVSTTPGFTKLINFFTINRTWRLVDLPGYGYARVARKDRARFNRAVAAYLQERPNLARVFALVDSALPPQPIDLEFIEWLAVNSVPFTLVFTKIDTVKPAVVDVNIAAFKEAIAGWFEELPEVISCSAVTRHGKADLLKVVAEALVNLGVRPAPDLPTRMEPSAENSARKNVHGTGTKMTRPW